MYYLNQIRIIVEPKTLFESAENPKIRFQKKKLGFEYAERYIQTLTATRLDDV